MCVGGGQYNFQENVEFVFPEVMKHSAGSRVEKWKISTLQFFMQLRNFNPPAFRQLQCELPLQ